MTREEFRTHKHLMERWAEGEKVQVFTVDMKWEDLDEPQWQLNTEYRISPKEEIIPMDFSDAERLISKTVKDKHYGLYTIVSTSKDSVYVGTSYTTYEELLEHYEFLDGSPIGKLSK